MRFFNKENLFCILTLLCILFFSGITLFVIITNLLSLIDITNSEHDIKDTEALYHQEKMR